MTEIIKVRYELPDVAVETERYLGQPTAPFVSLNGFPLPREGFHLLQLVEVDVVATGTSSTPQVQGLPLLFEDAADEGQFWVRWVFPGATAVSETSGSFWAIFYKD